MHMRLFLPLLTKVCQSKLSALLSVIRQTFNNICQATLISITNIVIFCIHIKNSYNMLFC